LRSVGASEKEETEPMHVIMESLGDPVWQIGGGIILLAALVLILALRSPEVHLAPQHQWFLTRLTLLVCLSCFLVLSAGVLLFHGANAASTAAPLVTQPTSATAAPHGGLSPTPVPTLSPTSMPSPSPTPFPALVPSPAQVLTTFCDAINQQDLNMAWGQYAKALQQKRAAPPPFQVRITIVHCRVEQVRYLEMLLFPDVCWYVLHDGECGKTSLFRAVRYDGEESVQAL
jgi:hypothetical protein